MEILSSARSTVLLDFQNLETICTYEGAQNDAADFKIFNGKKIFTQINKKNGLEFLEIRANNQTGVISNIIDNQCRKEKYEIQRLRKMKIENLYCVSPLKAYEIALGMSNGEIRVLNYKSNEYVNNFPAETSKHSVISLDYSHLDDHLASVYENGTINVYGMKTKAKLKTLNLDGNSTLARFNPKKRLRLATASHKGSVFLYDVQANKKIFQAVEAHSAPCRDLAMSLDHPDLLYSAGYDSVINVYDIKKKIRAQQIKSRYPLSTISVSECGMYCCAGNLKGELMIYDMRLLNNPLVERKVHNSAVIRVAFIPSPGSNSRSSIFPLQVQSESTSEDDRLSIFSNENTQRRDSFYDFIEFQNSQANCTNSNVNGATKKYRDSFDWEQLASKKLETEKRINKVSLNLVKSRLSGDHPSTSRLPRDVNLLVKEISHRMSNISESKFNSNSKILEVSEDELLVVDDQKNLSPGLDENDEIMSQQDGEAFLKVDDSTTITSTPNHANTSQLQRKSNQIKNPSEENFTICIEVLNRIKELKLDVDKKFEYLENEIKLNAETNKWNLYTQNFNFWRDQNKVNNDMCDALDLLLHSDDFYQDYLRLREENEQLKSTVEKLSKMKSY